ncbi:MAG: peptide chain release factor aRF-1 [Candidatus Bathyarchaeia archaeon]
MVTEKVTRFYGCQLTTTHSAKQHKLSKLIAWLSDKEAIDKEFISLYIPPQMSIDQVVARIKKDAESTTLDTKNSTDRLQEAAKNVLQHLKAKTALSETGLAIFAGTYVGNNQQKPVLNVEELIPPQPVTAYLCKADNQFELEPLRQMLRDERVIGLIALDAKQASFGLLVGDYLQLLETINSGVMGKTGKGGQSQRRYERERDMSLGYFFHRIAEHAAKDFLENHNITLLIIGGPGQTKHDFLKGAYLHYMLNDALFGVFDTQSASSSGVQEICEKSFEALQNVCLPMERKMMQHLMVELNKDNGLAIAGLDPVLAGLKTGQVEVALVTDSTDLIDAGATCKKCGLTKTELLKKSSHQQLQEFLSTPCTRCNSTNYELAEKDIIDVLEDVAAQTKARVEVVFTGSEEKAQLNALGGFAAILRFHSNISASSALRS